ncbi:glycosyltransferase [Adlercreutzia sp. ZJ304]|uniref:glycosyltransferase family 4 protein n=1 Tax=Adlercreutzia sp. ZJ304 TaxID=2709791 RepID=UPI0013EB0A7B|nr:glycosyltransferase [Adlercreutzia sp. ZJ304]
MEKLKPVDKMRVLWICNFPLPCMQKQIGFPKVVNEGWLEGLSSRLVALNGIELWYVFPQHQSPAILKGFCDGIEYRGFPVSSKNESYIDDHVILYLLEILEKCLPDVVHVMGTEYPHTLSYFSAIQGSPYEDHSIVSIQGLTSVYTHHYLTGIPYKTLKKKRLKDFIRGDVVESQKMMRKRGINEIETIKFAKHCFGRTTWDKTCVELINPSIQYHHGTEVLRQPFYGVEKWNIEDAVEGSIFMSQATSPIKGFHIALQSFALLLKRYPELTIKVAGSKNPFNDARWKQSAYERYLDDFAQANGLKNRIKYLGPLDAECMKHEYLSANVFVCSSTIENSPNSVGEAMILGVPVVCSDVGGVRDILKDGVSGLTYQVDAPYMLAHCIDRIFSNKQLAQTLSINEINKAKDIHNIDKALGETLEVYRSISRRG